MSKFTAKSPIAKPPKPSPSFPMFAHSVGQWAKKVKGRTHYFGAWRISQQGKAELLPNGGAHQEAWTKRLRRKVGLQRLR